MKIIVLGAGSFGTAIANELSLNPKNKVILFSSSKSKVKEINSFHTNTSCFPNKILSKELKASFDSSVISDANIVLIALPSSIILEVLKDLKDYFKKETLFVNLSKGLFDKGITIVEEITRVLNTRNVVSLKGPSFAVEIMESADTLLTLGYTTRKQYDIISSIIQNTSIHIDCTTDIRGVEILSVFKNIYALVLGVVDAKYNSPNTRFMILTKAFAEVRVLLRSLGGSEDTLHLACGFGDLCLTSLNDLSRNRTLGLLIGKGFYSSDFTDNSVVIEGLNTISIIHSFPLNHLRDQLPLLNKLSTFFDSKDPLFSIDFDELVDRKFKTVLTYGTFDLLHYGHLEILRRASLLGDKLVVGLSSDKFNKLKGKDCVLNYEKRKQLIESLHYVDKVIQEDSWEQKIMDIQDNDVDVLVMGSDWENKFNQLREYCDVVYLPRTEGISTTKIKLTIEDS